MRAALAGVALAAALAGCSDGGTQYSGSDILPPVVDSRIEGLVLQSCPDGGTGCPAVPLPYAVRVLNATTLAHVESATAGKDGSFTMTVPAGTYRVEAAPPADSGATCFPVDTAVPPGDRALIEIRCRR